MNIKMMAVLNQNYTHNCLYSLLTFGKQSFTHELTFSHHL